MTRIRDLRFQAGIILGICIDTSQRGDKINCDSRAINSGLGSVTICSLE